MELVNAPAVRTGGGVVGCGFDKPANLESAESITEGDFLEIEDVGRAELGLVESVVWAGRLSDFCAVEVADVCRVSDFTMAVVVAANIVRSVTAGRGGRDCAGLPRLGTGFRAVASGVIAEDGVREESCVWAGRELWTEVVSLAVPARNADFPVSCGGAYVR